MNDFFWLMTDLEIEVTHLKIVNTISHKSKDKNRKKRIIWFSTVNIYHVNMVTYEGGGAYCISLVGTTPIAGRFVQSHFVPLSLLSRVFATLFFVSFSPFALGEFIL